MKLKTSLLKGKIITFHYFTVIIIITFVSLIFIKPIMLLAILKLDFHENAIKKSLPLFAKLLSSFFLLNSDSFPSYVPVLCDSFKICRPKATKKNHCVQMQLLRLLQTKPIVSSYAFQISFLAPLLNFNRVSTHLSKKIWKMFWDRLSDLVCVVS